jgi:hypothetical protein
MIVHWRKKYPEPVSNLTSLLNNLIDLQHITLINSSAYSHASTFILLTADD